MGCCVMVERLCGKGGGGRGRKEEKRGDGEEGMHRRKKTKRLLNKLLVLYAFISQTSQITRLQ